MLPPYTAPVTPPLATEEEASRSFMSKLDGAFIESFWLELKNSAHVTTSGGVEGGEKQMVVTLREFMRLCKQHMCNPTASDLRLLERLFCTVDRRGKGVNRAFDVATTMVLVCNASDASKLRLLFAVFDLDDSGCLTNDEMFGMYRSIKVNDITRCRETIVADMSSGEAFSRREAERLFLLTLENLEGDGDCVSLDEFITAVTSRRYLVDGLLPAAFSLEWILEDYPRPARVTANGVSEAPRAGGRRLPLLGQQPQQQQQSHGGAQHSGALDATNSTACDDTGPRRSSHDGRTGRPRDTGGRRRDVPATSHDEVLERINRDIPHMGVMKRVNQKKHLRELALGRHVFVVPDRKESRTRKVECFVCAVEHTYQEKQGGCP
eukprot:NODE_4200_length_1923_cov_4.942094.p1 GENE.NODE_4200_length_1923_cov_4.942094~~NODE_4200_length_1923_cov_4.942094.p1  ORF type:complete len:379 (+),score=131.93 NODE_4200_length_1923_cov_4.942094:358-1494(+)